MESTGKGGRSQHGTHRTRANTQDLQLRDRCQWYGHVTRCQAKVLEPCLLTLTSELEQVTETFYPNFLICETK